MSVGMSTLEDWRSAANRHLDRALAAEDRARALTDEVAALGEMVERRGAALDRTCSALLATAALLQEAREVAERLRDDYIDGNHIENKALVLPWERKPHEETKT